jgi:hypothetical protein
MTNRARIGIATGLLIVIALVYGAVVSISTRLEPSAPVVQRSSNTDSFQGDRLWRI